jgi:hypothetical protein
MGQCIQKYSEGIYHRSARLDNETKYIINHPKFTPEELEDFEKRKNDTMQYLLRNSINSGYRPLLP